MQLPDIIPCTVSLITHSMYINDFPWLKEPARLYRLGNRIGTGRFGIVHQGIPVDSNHNQINGSPTIVIKTPHIQRGEGRPDEKLRERLQYIRQKNGEQLLHINQRLVGCSHFNPIIDLGEVYCDGDPDLPLPITIQPMLTNAIPLEQWLFLRRLRTVERSDNADGVDQSTWGGITNREDWCSCALMIAHALKEIHLRRVTHGDIHPGNIFVTTGNFAKVIFIDFGESFVATPARTYRPRNELKCYHAPELSSPSRTNESLDVYSFGILLKYLACGKEERIEPDSPTDVQRREIETKIRRPNSALIRGEPRIIDVISNCVMTDPAGRPRMADVCDELNRILTSSPLNAQPRIWECCPHLISSPMQSELQTVVGALAHVSGQDGSPLHPVLVAMLQREVSELSAVFSTMPTEMVDLYGTRDRMLRVLINLVDELSAEDSWTSATTLNVWQGGALGLAGRYSSASIRATLRGASIRRVLILSVEELGLEFSERLAKQLEHTECPELRRLGSLWHQACNSFATSYRGAQYTSEEVDVSFLRSVQWHRDRIRKFATFWRDVFHEWDLDAFLDRDTSFSIKGSKGCRISILPVASRADAEKCRADNPATLMYLPSKGADEKSQWLLVTAETRGRRDASSLGNRPHLIGVRVHPSVFGLPKERITYMSTLATESVNVTAHLDHLVAMLDMSR